MDGLFDNEGAAPPSPARKRPGPKPKAARLDIEVSASEPGKFTDFALRLDTNSAELLEWYCKRRDLSPPVVIAAALRDHLVPIRDRRVELERKIRAIEKEMMDQFFNPIEPANGSTPSAE